MGCSGSKAPKVQLCTSAQVFDLCETAAREMLVLCAKAAVNNLEQIDVLAPPEIVNLRKDISRMRSYGKAEDGPGQERDTSMRDCAFSPFESEASAFTSDSQLLESWSESQADTSFAGSSPDQPDTTATNLGAIAASPAPLRCGKAKAKAKSKSKAKAKRKTKKNEESTRPTESFKATLSQQSTNDTLSDTDAGVSKTLSGFADSVEALVDKVVLNFQEVGNEIASENSTQILKVLGGLIVNMGFSRSDATEIVRGFPPYGQAEFAAVPTDAVCKFLFSTKRQGLVDGLMPLCRESINKHAVTSIWSSAILEINELCKTVDNLGIDIKLAPIELDIQDYVVSQIAEQLGILMCREEAFHRSLGGKLSGTTRCPELFEEVFGGSLLNQATYAKVMPSFPKE